MRWAISVALATGAGPSPRLEPALRTGACRRSRPSGCPRLSVRSSSSSVSSLQRGVQKTAPGNARGRSVSQSPRLRTRSARRSGRPAAARWGRRDEVRVAELLLRVARDRVDVEHVERVQVSFSRFLPPLKLNILYTPRSSSLTGSNRVVSCRLERQRVVADRRRRAVGVDAAVDVARPGDADGPRVAVVDGQVAGRVDVPRQRVAAAELEQVARDRADAVR